MSGGAEPTVGARNETRAWAIAAAVAAFVSFLPFLRGLLAGRTFYFRDLSRQFWPSRLYVLQGLLHGELRFWNPYNHEGIPLPFSPVGYPLELLQVLWPTGAGLSLLLALHVPLAALAFLLLARELRLSPLAAAGGGLVYALGGFTLSTLNFYVYLHAMAWAPVVLWGVLRAAEGGRRRLAVAAVVGAIAWTTAGVELVAQAFAVATVLAWRRGDAKRLGRAAAAAALSLGLAAPVLLVMSGATAGTARAQGFSADLVLNQSIHPFTWLQVVVGQLYGVLSGGAERWWGANFFENGFPYILSLYLGAAALAVAAGGAAHARPERPRLLLLALLAIVICLGRFAGWERVIDALPASLRGLRFPTKAFFTVHLVVALLVAFGLEALAQGRRRAQSAIAAAGLALGGALTLAPALPALAPASTAWFIRHFFPPGVSPLAGAELLDSILADAAVGGGVAVLAGLVALGGRLGALSGAGAGLLTVALMAADLLRTGAGLNPMVDPAFLRPSEPVLALVAAERPTRVHTCEPVRSAAYWRGRAARPARHEAYTFAVWRDALAPHYNMSAGVPSALSEDTTALVPLSRVPPPGLSCRDMDAAAPVLREAGVTHVVSLDPLDSPLLSAVGTAAPPVIAPAVVHLYALAGALPRLDVEPAGHVRVISDASDRLRLEVTASQAGRVIVRDGFAPGWSASVDGRETRVEPFAGRHRAVAVPAGRSVVEMSYRAPGGRTGLAVMTATAALLVLLCARPLRPAARESGASPGTAAP
ncbi:MAG TPA: hypothetical protein VFQ51_16440 [Vicinamibacteria bacterium]|nr:hypothetical protein [Vicinamibacteria bacterium]